MYDLLLNWGFVLHVCYGALCLEWHDICNLLLTSCLIWCHLFCDVAFVICLSYDASNFGMMLFDYAVAEDESYSIIPSKKESYSIADLALRGIVCLLIIRNSTVIVRAEAHPLWKHELCPSCGLFMLNLWKFFLHYVHNAVFLCSRPLFIYKLFDTILSMLWSYAMHRHSESSPLFSFCHCRLFMLWLSPHRKISSDHDIVVL